MPSQTLSSSACWPEGKGRKGQEQPERLLCSGRAAARRHLHESPVKAFAPAFRLQGGYVYIVLQSDRSCCYRYDCGGMLEYIRQLRIWLV